MIVVNLDKAKNITHELRRSKRAEEFAPLDVQVTIPSKANEAEILRQEIRDKYSLLQQQIDGTSDLEVLSQIAKDLK